MILLMTMGVVLSLMGSNSLFALDPSRPLHQYAVDIWTAEQGLPQNSVSALLQTPDGYLWLGTFDGLVRFNGLTFDTFNPVELFQARNKVIVSLASRKAGGFYIATSSVIGVYWQGKFSCISNNEELTNLVVQTIFEDRSGALWIGTKNGGLRQFKDGRIASLTTSQGLPHNNVRALAEDRAGDLWVGTEKGLCQIHQGKMIVYNRENGMRSEYVLSLHIDSAGCLWVGTLNGGVCYLKDGRLESLPLVKNKEYDSVTCMTSESTGALWMGTLTGLLQFRNGRFDFLTSPWAPLAVIIRSLLPDREGNLWVGTNGAGLIRLKDGKFTTYTTEDGLSHHAVMSISGNRQGTFWIGTNGGGLNILREGRFQHLTSHDGLNDDSIWCVCYDYKGNLWAGSSSSGLNRLRNGKISILTTKDGLYSNEIRALWADPDGSLWVGTRGGLNHIAGDKVSGFARRDGLSSGEIRSLWGDGKGTLWIGTFGGGLNRLRAGQFKSYRQGRDLPSDYIQSLYVDSAGILWIGTNGGGLARMEGDSLFAYSRKDGLPSDNIFQILEDDFGNLWLSYPRGVFRVSRNLMMEYAHNPSPTLQITNYSRFDGLPAADLAGGMQPAGFKDEKGILWFPTMGGLACIDPSKEEKNLLPPLVALEAIKINDQITDGLEVGKFPPGAGKLEFHYSGLSLQAPEKVRFQYQLVGFDRQWSSAGNQRVAIYTNIPPGDYTFQVKACNNDDVWNENPARYSFTLQPHFYQTWYFYFGCALMAFLLAATVYSLRIRQLRGQQRRLKFEVEKALTEIQTLSGLLPICAACKKIRDDQGYWNQIESYISEHSQASFSHGICPECAFRLYPDFYTPDSPSPSDNEPPSPPPN
jgi:ligand-binding sensor domain-containing protein